MNQIAQRFGGRVALVVMHYVPISDAKSATACTRRPRGVFRIPCTTISLINLVFLAFARFEFLRKASPINIVSRNWISR